VTPLVAAVGAERVAPGGPADAVDGIVPHWVVRPGSVAEVQACVRVAAAEGWALVASGLGAHLDVGAPPVRLDVLVRLDRLARVLDHQPGDMTITAEAGCPLGAVAEALAPAGQWLPLDPPRAARTTVGGLIAANLSGALRASQGTARDLLLGLRFVGADGALVAGGGRVVKNVAGYDLPKLHVGALGTLGVIVEATFKVRPRPALERAAIVRCGSPGEAVALARTVEAGPVPPLWLWLAGRGGLTGDAGAAAEVAVGLGGIAEEVAEGEAVVRRAAAGRPVTEIVDGAALRARLVDVGSGPAAAVLHLGVLPTEVGAAVEAVEAAAGGVRCVADPACGVVRVLVARAEEVRRLVETLRPGLAARGGSLVVARAGECKRDVDVWGDPGPGLGLMRGVKAAFDPARVLAPGRFVGGL
jgi:glycolate oxidase FAD binding subunit